MHSRLGETADLLLLLRDVSTIRERRPSLVDTVPSRPPFMPEVERTVESTTEIEIEIELELDPPPPPPLYPFNEEQTHLLPACFDEDLLTDQWRAQHEVDDPDLVPRVALIRPRADVPLLRRAAAIGGSCLIVLVMAVVVYSVVVHW